ncbi:MAG TPA: lamin tail domain-containing protein [Anaerolineaceae bacterium]|nr:lamin tail domain-containing protein [Anaerolineaceae bacterium]
MASAIVPKTTEASAASPTQATPGELNLLIGGVFGAGDLQTEYVLIKNQGKATANLLNWNLQGKRGQNYSFPDLRLAQNGTVKIFTKTGTDTVLELYMKSDASLWQQGDILTLKDANGKVQTTFQVP